MEEKFGLVKGTECKFVKTDPEVIEGISKKTGIEQSKVKSMMRYNIFRVNQFSQLSQLAIPTIRNKIRPSIIDKDGTWGTELDYCYPFQDNDGEGPLFIIRNEKAERYLQA